MPKLSKYNVTEDELNAIIKKARTQILSAHTSIISSITLVAGAQSIRQQKGEAFRLPDKYNAEIRLLSDRLAELDRLFRGIKDEGVTKSSKRKSHKP